MKILLGFEVGTGKEIYMENHHTVVTGMTQLSGKTTTLEALVHRGNVKAIAFLTKRGESGFRGQREIPAYFKEQRKGRLIDWRYASSILEATMGEKMKFERSWIIKVCKGAGSLEEVYKNILAEKEKTKRGLDESIYTNLGAYFEIILPEIEKYKFADKISLKKGFNVMNLIGISDEMQQLIIESTLSYVLQKEKNTVVIIPEAHKFIPQGNNTPVKGTALRLIREGAAVGNYLWIDTQETTSVDKKILKQCSNWIMGYQQERNEVANVRENIGRRKIKEEDIMTLKIGHFIASLQQEIAHVYVLPAGVDPSRGLDVALGLVGVATVKNEIAVDVDSIREEIGKVPVSDNLHVFAGSENPKFVNLSGSTITLEDGRELAPGESIEDIDRVAAVKEIFQEALKKPLPPAVTEITLKRRIVALEKALDVLQGLHDNLILDLGTSEGTVERLTEDYKEYKKNTEDQEKAYRDGIDALKLTVENVTGELEKAHLRGNLLTEKLVDHEAFLDSLFKIIRPLIPETPTITGTIDEKTIEKLVNKVIDKLPAKKRQKIEAGDTGIPWVDMWLPKLKKPVERKIVTLLAAKLGVPLNKDQIALATGYTVTGGTFLGALSTLKNKYKLIIQDGDMYSIVEAPV